MILPIIGLSQNRYQWKEIKYQDGKSILKSTGEPVTGIVEGKGGWISTWANDYHAHKAVIEDGIYISSIAYYKNGQIHHKLENNYLIRYAPNNGLKTHEGGVMNGQKHGLIKEYDPEGNLEKEINYNNGSKDGSFKIYHKNGETWQEGQYLDGVKVGLWTTYSKKGEIKKQKEYKSISR